MPKDKEKAGAWEGAGGRAASKVKFQEPKGEEAEEARSPTVEASEDEVTMGVKRSGQGQSGVVRVRAPERLDTKQVLRQKSVGRTGGKMVMEVTQEVGASQLAAWLGWSVSRITRGTRWGLVQGAACW